MKRVLRFAALQGKSLLCIPLLEIARPQSQFPHSCVCERIIYSQDWSTYFLQQNRQTDLGNIYISHRYMSVGTGRHYNFVLEITVSFHFIWGLPFGSAFLVRSHKNFLYKIREKILCDDDKYVGFCYSSWIFFIPEALVSVPGTLVLLGAAVSKNVHRNVLFQLLRRKRLHEYRIYNRLNTFSEHKTS